MEIKKIHIGGNREEINRITKKHTPNLIDTVKRSDLIFTPELLVRKLFNGTDIEYDNWLMKYKLHPSQINYHDINQKEQLLKRLRVYTMRLLEEAKIDSIFFSNQLANMLVNKWLDSFDTLENHIYDLSDFDKLEFLKISDEFKKQFTTYSPFAFLMIDEPNQQLKVVASHKVLLLLKEKLPMGNKRGTAVGQEPKRLYQNFFTTIGYKGKGELTEGLNYHRLNFKNFNFNVNIETRLLNDIIYDKLGYNREEIQVAFLFGAYGKKLYFESDIKGTERKKEELEALAIAEDIPRTITKELHRDRKGSIAVDKTTSEVEKRIPNLSITPSILKEDSIAKIENKKEEMVIIENEEKKEELAQPLSSSLEEFEKEMFIRQQGYAQLAKTKIDEAIENRNQYIEEFHTFLKKGMSVTDALNKFSERYANNPYIKGIIETSITGELQLQSLKDKGIEELIYNVNVLKSEKQGLMKDLDIKETEIASLNQNMESLVVAHNKQLEEIEIKVYKLVEDKRELVKTNQTQSEMITELEKLIVQYEQTLKHKDAKISEKDKEISRIKEESQYYARQIENLKEENRLFLSTMDLLKINNNQLEKKNSEQEDINNRLSKEIERLKEEILSKE